MCRAELSQNTQTTDRIRRSARLPRLIGIVVAAMALAIFGQSQVLAQAPTVTAVFNNSIPGNLYTNCANTLTVPGNGTGTSYQASNGTSWYPWNSGSFMGGYTITIVGTNLSGVTKVNFGTYYVTSGFSNNTATQVTVTVPALGTANWIPVASWSRTALILTTVTVTNSGGTSSGTAATTGGTPPVALGGSGTGSTNQYMFCPPCVTSNAANGNLQMAPLAWGNYSNTPVTLAGQYLWGAVQFSWYTWNSYSVLSNYSDSSVTATFIPNTWNDGNFGDFTTHMHLYCTSAGTNEAINAQDGANGGSKNGFEGSQSVNRTGTMTATTSSGTVTGVGTLFLTELNVGSVIYTSGNSQCGTVYSIQSNTSLTLASNTAGSWTSTGAVAANPNTNVAYRALQLPTINTISVTTSTTQNPSVTVYGIFPLTGNYAVNFGGNPLTGGVPNPVIINITAGNTTTAQNSPAFTVPWLTAGVYTVTIWGEGGISTSSATYTYAPGCIITPSTLPNWTANVAGYSQTLTSSNGNGTYTCTVSAGSLPPGLNLTTVDATHALISGTPTTAGSYPFTILSTDGASKTGTQAYTVVINAAPSITTTTLPNAPISTAYSQTLATLGGTAPLTFTTTATTGSFPTGITLSAAGVLSGTPTVLGTSTFTVTVTDALGVQAVSPSLSVTVTTPPTVTAVFNNSIPTNLSLSATAKYYCAATVTMPAQTAGAPYTTYPWNSGSYNGGYTATIVGTNLSGATSVSFGGTAATNITNNTATQLTCTVPLKAYVYNNYTTVVVTVTTASAGTSSGTATLTAGAAPTVLGGPGGGSTNQFIYAPGQVYWVSGTVDQYAPCYTIDGASLPQTMFGQYLYGALQTDYYPGNARWGVCIPAYSDAATTAVIMPNISKGMGNNAGTNQVCLYFTCTGNVYTTNPSTGNCAYNAGQNGAAWGTAGNYPAAGNNGYGEGAAITQSGTISSTASTGTVTGTSTTFTKQVSVGSGLWASTSGVGATCAGGNFIGTVYSIQDDTHLTLANVASNAAWTSTGGLGSNGTYSGVWASGPIPTITGITGTIAAGNSITLNGTWRIGPVAVNFGTDFMTWYSNPTGAPPNPAFYNVTADNQAIVVTVPPSAFGYNSLRVTNLDGTSLPITAPSATTVTCSKAAGTYTTGVVIPITVNFSSPVTVTGTPKLTLNSGAVVNYTSGSGTSALLFNYTVATGQETAHLDYGTNTTALALNGGTIGNGIGTVTLTLPTNGTSGLYTQNIVIDSTLPVTATVTNPPYSATPNTYSAAQLVAALSSSGGNFQGQAADDTNGVGLIANVTTFTLVRSSDGKYWSGNIITQWTSTYTALSTTHAAQSGATAVTWTSSATLPTWTSLGSDTYTVTATATDKAGNSYTGTGASVTTFIYTNTAPTVAVNQPVNATSGQYFNAANLQGPTGYWNATAYASGAGTTTFGGTADGKGANLTANTTFTIQGPGLSGQYWNSSTPGWQAGAYPLTTNQTAGTASGPWTSTDTLPNWATPANGGQSNGDGLYNITATATNSTAPVTASVTFTLDNTPPTITVTGPFTTSGGSTPLTYAAGGPAYYTVTYYDLNFNSTTLTAGNISLNPTGTANGTIAVGTPTTTGTGATVVVTVSSITGDGTLGITIAAGTSTDKAGNADVGPSGPSGTFTVDNTLPTIAIGAPSATSATSGNTVTFTVTYADANFNSSTLASGNVTLNKTGTASATAAVSGTGTTRTVTLNGFTGYGTVGISIAAGTATDLANNQAPAAGPSATIIVNPPIITGITPPSGPATGGPSTVVISGSNLSGANSITFAGQPATFSFPTYAILSAQATAITTSTPQFLQDWGNNATTGVVTGNTRLNMSVSGGAEANPQGLNTTTLSTSFKAAWPGVPQAIFNYVREAPSTWIISGFTPGGSYTVTLFMGECYFTDNTRRGTYTVQGSTTANVTSSAGVTTANYSMVNVAPETIAGGRNLACYAQWPNVTADGSGNITITMVSTNNTAELMGGIAITSNSPVVTPPAITTGGGVYPVVATNSATGLSGTGTFSYQPVVSSITPPGGGTTPTGPVTINGQGFTGATSVQFGTYAPVALTPANVASDTQLINVTPPVASGSGAVAVTVTAQGTGASASATSSPFLGTGTVTASTSTATVTGTGTSFTTQLTPGQLLYASNGTSVIGTISSVNSTTSLTLTASSQTAQTTTAAFYYGGAYTYLAPPTVTDTTVSKNQKVPANATTLVITGTNFDPNPVLASNTNVITLNGAGLTSYTATLTGTPSLTSLTVQLPTGAPLTVGQVVNAVVTSFGASSGTAVNVATVIASPTITASTLNRAQDATTLTITGTGFDPTALTNNVVTFSGAAAGGTGVTLPGSVTFVSADGTTLTYTFTANLPSIGELDAIVTVNGGASGPP